MRYSTVIMAWILSILAWFLLIGIGAGFSARARRFPLKADRRRYLRRSAEWACGTWLIVGLLVHSPWAIALPLYLWPLLSPWTMTLYPAMVLSRLVTPAVPLSPSIAAPVITIVMTSVWTFFLWLPALVLRHPRVPVALCVVSWIVLWLIVVGGYLYGFI